jgi:hypothetical protein
MRVREILAADTGYHRDLIEGHLERVPRSQRAARS